jgi:uncharacterized tellurite resistance protein B-like protein
MNIMNYKSVITRLYFLLINSDGKVNHGEISLGKKMTQAEGISEAEFNAQLESLAGRDRAEIYKECLRDLKVLKSEQQIRSIAWMCVLANSDGFMDKSEWQFIYKIYHKELHLALDDIMHVQKELSLMTRDNLYSSSVMSGGNAPRPVF